MQKYMAHRKQKGIYQVYEESNKQKRKRYADYVELVTCFVILVLLEHIIKYITQVIAKIIT